MPRITSASVRDTADPRVVMPGAIYGEGYRELGSHCFAYIHATEVGGTHPALIEAMGRGALTLYLDTPENAEVAGGAGLAVHARESGRGDATGSRHARSRARDLAGAGHGAGAIALQLGSGDGRLRKTADEAGSGSRCRSWVEVSLGTIRENYRAVREVVKDAAEIMPVVKADAYRHGAVEVSRALEAEGAPLAGGFERRGRRRRCGRPGSARAFW